MLSERTGNTVCIRFLVRVIGKQWRKCSWGANPCDGGGKCREKRSQGITGRGRNWGLVPSLRTFEIKDLQHELGVDSGRGRRSERFITPDLKEDQVITTFSRRDSKRFKLGSSV